MAETTACWTAICTAASVGISKLQIETDSLLLQRGVLTDEMDQAPAGVIFQDIHRVIRDHFLCFECLHVPRLCNSFAHEIAALDMCWDVGMSEVCEYPVPNFVQNLVARDLVELLLIKGLSGEIPKKKSRTRIPSSTAHVFCGREILSLPLEIITVPSLSSKITSSLHCHSIRFSVPW